MKDYEAYFESRDEIKIGEVMEVDVQDKETFEEISVKAIISDKKEDFEPGDYDNLWIEFGGHLGIDREHWYIKILEEKEDEIQEVASPKRRVKTSLGQRRGFMIRSMIEERQKKEE